MRHKVQGYITFLLDNSLLLIIGTVAGLVWANLHLSSYEKLAHRIHFVVNDVGMAFFFGIAAKEVFEAILPGGPLASPRKAAMPLLATAGGMVVPAALFVTGALLVGRPDLTRGWAIPCATDIAFSYLVARFVFGPGHPAIPFLLLLAIADDGLGLLILALFYPTGDVNLLIFIGLVAAAVVAALALKKIGVMNFWPYILLSGSLSWLGFYFGGFHPALALVPVIFLTAKDQRADRIEGFRTGIDAYVTKPFEPDELLAVITSIFNRLERTRSEMARLVGDLSLPEPSPVYVEELTEAEARIAEAVARGLSNKDIAFELKISVRTVENHISHILAKKGFSNRVEIARYILESRSAD